MLNGGIERGIGKSYNNLKRQAQKLSIILKRGLWNNALTEKQGAQV
jgi:hypothetical protein